MLVLFRLHAFGGPLETDECNYAYIGERLLAGDDLYTDVWDHQPPGVFAWFAGLAAVFGRSETTIRLFAMIWTVVTCVLIYRCARAGLTRQAAWLAAVVYALASSDPGMAGEGANREIYMNALVMGGLALLLPGRSPAGAAALSLRRIALAGVLFGLASTFKTVIAGQWLCVVIGVVLWQSRGARQTPRRVVVSILAFGVGPAAIWGGLALYFASTDRFALFWEAVFAYNVGYSKLGAGVAGRFAAFFDRWSVFRTALPLWLAGGAGLVLVIRRRSRRPQWSIMITMMTAGSYLATCLPGLFWNHYYLLMLPCLAILAATVCDVFTPQAEAPAKLRRACGIGIMGVLCGGLLVSQSLWYLLVPADRVGFQRYGSRMLRVRTQADRVAAVTQPEDDVFVWGRADTGLYYYANRRCASRFTMIGGLLGEDSATRDRQALLLEDLLRRKPRVIVIVLDPGAPPFPALQRFLQEHRYVSAGRDPAWAEILCDMDRPIARVDWSWAESTP